MENIFKFDQIYNETHLKMRNMFSEKYLQQNKQSLNA